MKKTIPLLILFTLMLGIWGIAPVQAADYSFTPDPGWRLIGGNGAATTTITTVSATVTDVSGNAVMTAGATNPTVTKGGVVVNGVVNQGLSNEDKTLTFTLPAGLAAGQYDISIAWPGNNATGVLQLGTAGLDKTYTTVGYSALIINISGTSTQFQASDTVELLDAGSSVIAEAITGKNVSSASQLSFTLQPGRIAGNYKIRLTTSGGILELPFSVRGIALDKNSLTEGYSGSQLITVNGTNTAFDGTTTITLYNKADQTQVTGKISGISASSSTVLSFSLAEGLTKGNYELRVQTGPEELKTDLFVKGIELQYSAVTEGYTSPFTVTVNGTNTSFSASTTAVLMNGTTDYSNKISSRSFADGQPASGSLVINTGLTAGTYTLRLTSGSEVVTANIIISPAAALSLNPASITAGNATAVAIAVTGSNTHFTSASTVEMLNAADNSTVVGAISGSPACTDATHLSFNLAANRTAGSYKIRITSGSEVLLTNFTVTSAAAPQNVTGLTAIPGKTSLQLNWTNPTDASRASFKVYYKASGGTYNAGTAIADPAVSTFPLSSLNTNTSYIVKITTLNSDSSAESAGVEITAVTDGTAPNLTFTAPAGGYVKPGSVSLAANATDELGGSGPDKVVFESKTGTAPYTVIAEVNNPPYTAALDVTGGDGTQYDLRATAYDKAGNTRSVVKTVTLDNTAPPSPVITGFTRNETTASISWNPVVDSGSGVVGYHVYQDNSIEGTFSIRVNPTMITGTSCQINNLTAGNPYWFKVQAVDNAGNVSQLSEARGSVQIAATATDALVSMESGNTTVSSNNTWVITVAPGLTLKTVLSPTDVIVTGLEASGLTASIAKGEGNTIIITVNGTANPAIQNTVPVSIIVKGSAVNEAGALDSAAINVSLQPKSDCFIATAAFGSYLDPHVWSLRHFRDNVLLNFAAGRWFVREYYQHSPALAAVIAQHDGLRIITRILLTPIVIAVEYPLWAVLVLAGLIGLIVIRIRQRKTALA